MITNKQNRRRVDNIPAGTYEGYVWESDKDKPMIYNDAHYSFLPDVTANPFVVEGQLYDYENEKSYSIKYIDGSYHIHAFDIPKDIANSVELVKYLPNRMAHVKALLFEPCWEEQPDELCEGMTVLKPAGMAFVGFEYIKEDK